MMKLAAIKLVLAAVCGGQFFGMAALANDSTANVPFRLPAQQDAPFIHPIFIKSEGRIVLDVAAAPPETEITLLLRRPDGTAASHITGTGGNLSLTYFASRPEVNEFLISKNVRWPVEISKAPGGNGVSGRLKISQPEP